MEGATRLLSDPMPGSEQRRFAAGIQPHQRRQGGQGKGTPQARAEVGGPPLRKLAAHPA
jgi:hypothetical protein